MARRETLERYRAERQAVEERSSSRLLRVCVFLGALEEDGQHGCLLHPSRHEGVDARDCGAYGSSEVCSSFRCEAYLRWSGAQHAAIVEACSLSNQPLLYGWVLNDFPLVEAALELLGEPWDREGLRALLELKSGWPFRDPELPVVGEHLDPGIPLEPLDYEELGRGPSELDAMLVALRTHVSDQESLEEAEAMIRDCLPRRFDPGTAEWRPSGG